jgi:tetratricopeptide (TPR) repeat protein
MFGMVAMPIAARQISEFVESLPERWLWRSVRNAAVVALLASTVVLVYLLPWPSVVRSGIGLRKYAFPIRATDYFLANRLSIPFFNTFHFGGYMEWRTGGPVFQDGRGLLQAGDEETAIAGPQNYPLFTRIDARYGFEALVVAYPAPDAAAAAALAESAPGADWGADRSRWALVAFDDGGMLYLRRGGRYQSLIERDEYRYTRPANTVFSVPPDQAPLILADLRRSVVEAPACVRCRQLLASACLAGRNFEEAWTVVQPALPDDRVENAAVFGMAAFAAESLGRHAEAAQLYRKLISMGVTDAEPRRSLARVLLRQGDVGAAQKAMAPVLGNDGASTEDLALGREIARLRGDAGAEAELAGRRQAQEKVELAASYEARAMAAVGKRELQAGVSWLQASIQVMDRPSARTNLGNTFMDLGRVPEAITEYQRSIELAPRYGMAYFGLGVGLASQGNRAGAIAAYRSYLNLEPGGFYAARAKMALDQLERR